MFEEGLEDFKNLHTELKTYEVGANYLKTAQSVSFSEICIFTVELSTSEHWRPEVKAA